MAVRSIFNTPLIDALDIKWADMSGYYFKEEHYMGWPVAVLSFIALSFLGLIEPWNYIFGWIDGSMTAGKVWVEGWDTFLAFWKSIYLTFGGVLMFFINLLIILPLDILWVCIQFFYWLLFQTIF